jgi:hypothetical protein
VSPVRVIVAALAIYLLLKIGFRIIGGLAAPVPGPPPEGELRKVNLRFQCSVCGAEIRMMRAANEDPTPPRHCMDEMELVKPKFE